MPKQCECALKQSERETIVLGETNGLGHASDPTDLVSSTTTRDPFAKRAWGRDNGRYTKFFQL